MGYRMENSLVEIVSFSNEVTLTAENEDDFQEMLLQLNIQYKNIYEKTESMELVKEPVRCTLMVYDNFIAQVSKFKCCKPTFQAIGMRQYRSALKQVITGIASYRNVTV